MNKRKSDVSSEKDSQKGERVISISYKSLLRFFGYVGTVILSFFQGWFTRVAILPIYPYSQTRPIGWMGLTSYLAMYGTIGGIVIKKNLHSANQKRSIGTFIIVSIAGTLIYLLGLIIGIKKSEIFSIGIDYGVYSNSNTKKWKTNLN